jgi:methyltransferase (TIGR00027 family)
MKTGVGSRTALGVARLRAAHQHLDDPIIFRDPLASRIAAGADTTPSSGQPDTPFSRSLRAFIAARSRFTEDQIAVFFNRGVRQYVVLGAGLDTFAYRNPFAPALKVFEVDHPKTQAQKLQCLKAAAISIPDSLTYIPVNFEGESLARALETTPGFDTASLAFFSLLGVTVYLTLDTLLTTLRVIASLPPGSGVAFDYVSPTPDIALREKIFLERLSERVSMLGEPFRLMLDPGEFSRILHELGFVDIEDVGRCELNTKYFCGRRDGFEITGKSARIISARTD